MHDTPTTLLVAERDESTRAFLLDNLAADGYKPLGAQTEEETRLKLRNHGPALLVLGGFGEERHTCRLRPTSATIAIKPRSLEITHTCRLRKKLARAGAPHNIRGVGYRLSVGSVPEQPRPVAASRNGHAA